jgi:hypothetical protein
VAGGSYTGDGGDGRFADMPMSGTNSDTSGQAIMWAFQVGTRDQLCSLWPYVPTSGSPRDAAARSAHFAIVHGTSTGNTTYVNPPGDKLVNQGAHHSSWQSLGTYGVTNGMIGSSSPTAGRPADTR